MRIFWTIIFLLAADKIFADAIPHLDNEKIDLIYETSLHLSFDSCCIIFTDHQTNLPDTFCRCQGWECISVADINQIKLIRHIPDSFKVILFYKHRIIVSPTLNENGINSYHRLLISDSGVIDTTPIFKIPYSKYFEALLATIIIELLVGLLYFYRKKIALTNLQFIVYCNLLSHPLLWLTCAYFIGFGTGLLWGEFTVFVIEAILMSLWAKTDLTFDKCISLSFQINIASFILGGLIYLNVG